MDTSDTDFETQDTERCRCEKWMDGDMKQNCKLWRLMSRDSDMKQRDYWKAAVHGVAEGRTLLSDFPFTFHFHALEKEMATHSSVLAWRIPGKGEPGGLPSMESHRVGHD